MGTAPDGVYTNLVFAQRHGESMGQRDHAAFAGRVALPRTEISALPDIDVAAAAAVVAVAVVVVVAAVA